MTARELYDGALIELNKENAPNLILEDFNYFANKAINLYVNKRYNIYDMNLQTTDDLRVLKSTATLTPEHINVGGLTLAGNGDNLAYYEAILPSDYLHILNCICVYKVKKTYKCYNKDDTWRAAATRLTADAYSQIMDNFWNKPTYKKPYYYIHNVNTSIENPGNPYDSTTGRGTDYPQNTPKVVSYVSVGTTLPSDFSQYPVGTYLLVNDTTLYKVILNNNNERTATTAIADICIRVDGNLKKTGGNGVLSLYEGPVMDDLDAFGNPIYKSDNTESIIFTKDDRGYSNVQRSGGLRYGNASQVRMEIRYGTDNSIFELTNVYIDYVKAPQIIRLTQEQLDYTEDRSQVLEWPDYVCQEIINELVNLIMENILDQRIQTHPVVTLSIANPAQQLTPQS